MGLFVLSYFWVSISDVLDFPYPLEGHGIAIQSGFGLPFPCQFRILLVNQPLSLCDYKYPILNDTKRPQNSAQKP